jgi:hypothetical protein
MRIENIMGLPIVIIDNFYSDEECENIWQELEFLQGNSEVFGGAEKTGSAWRTIDGEKVLLKKNRGIFLDSVYQDREFSKILKVNRKIFSKDFVNKLIDNHVIFRYILESKKDSTLIQYYENSDHYGEHGDNATITSIAWFYKKPKAFTGGSIVFENNFKVECLFNRMIIFPSILRHSVEKVNLGENFLNQNYGRYSITQFINMD